MDKIGVFISAYNAEKTLAKTLESVLTQTYQNFEIYLADNGSTDKTFEIVKDYSKRFDSIVCYRHQKNQTGSFMSTLYGLCNKENYDVTLYYKYDEAGHETPIIRKCADWLCFIDSDDTLQPTYLEDLLHFAKENQLDMAMCGWDFVRPNRVDHRVSEKDEVIYHQDFAVKLPDYDKFMGPIWNKLFRYESLIRNLPYYEDKFSRLFKDGVYFYGADTAFNYFYLGNALDKFGILAKSLYCYQISEESVSRKHFHPMRIIADRRMAEVRFDFLQEIGEKITEENREFILNIYFKSINATMDLLLHDERYNLKEKMMYLQKMFHYKLMEDAFFQEREQYL
ncbi:MAG: glycosyltransferase family 2 protein [Anaerotruncus sp.]|nr:glycosyltransferase family 2 protein [Anaerotruncus sp.]